MTPEELDDIVGELYPPSFRDPGLIPECFALALRELGQVATGKGLGYRCEDAELWAEQMLRRMVQRAKNGIPLTEKEDVRG